MEERLQLTATSMELHRQKVTERACAQESGASILRSPPPKFWKPGGAMCTCFKEN